VFTHLSLVATKAAESAEEVYLLYCIVLDTQCVIFLYNSFEVLCAVTNVNEL
jgi:hypothetical protein